MGFNNDNGWNSFGYNDIIVGTNVAEHLGPGITVEQKRCYVIVGRLCCTRKVWAHISSRMAKDGKITLYNINARITKDLAMNRQHIGARTTYVMWPEEHHWNFYLLQVSFYQMHLLLK